MKPFTPSTPKASKEAEEEKADSTMSLSPAGGLDSEATCPVCWDVLAEPVAWPDCGHHFCLLCSLRTRHRLLPVCPLCRTPAGRIRKGTEMQVDCDRVAQVKDALGHLKYETFRRKIWGVVSDLDVKGFVGELPLFSMGPRNFVAGSRQSLPLPGSQQKLRVCEPEYQEVLKRACAPGGRRSFAVVLQPAAIEAGATCRVCDILDSAEDSDGVIYVLVEGGIACKVLTVESDSAVQGAAPLLRGTLEEVDEEEASRAVPGGDAPGEMIGAEISEIMGTLGLHLRMLQQRRLTISLLGFDAFSSEDSSSDGREEEAAVRSLEDSNIALMETMSGLLSSYRRSIQEMDQLLTEASRTADRLEAVASRLTDSSGSPTVVEEQDSSTAWITTASPRESPEPGEQPLLRTPPSVQRTLRECLQPDSSITRASTADPQIDEDRAPSSSPRRSIEVSRSSDAAQSAVIGLTPGEGPSRDSGATAPPSASRASALSVGGVSGAGSRVEPRASRPSLPRSLTLQPGSSAIVHARPSQTASSRPSRLSSTRAVGQRIITASVLTSAAGRRIGGSAHRQGIPPRRP